MDLLLILTYVGLCVVIFKVFRIPLTKWTVPTAALGGIVLIGALLLLMNYNHPYSEVSRQYFVTTPIIPQVKGRVIEVPVEPNVLVQKGEVLFKIDPRPFQQKVENLRARLKRETVERDRNKEELDRSLVLLRKGAGSEREAQSWRIKYETAVANIEAIEASLDEAQFNLEQTVVRAPEAGFVTQLTLRPGMMAVPLPLSPTMVFVHDEAKYFVGWFRQNSLLRLEPGGEAEVILDAIPGMVFKGKIHHFQPAISEGQVKPTADLVSSRQAMLPGPGRVPVFILITDPAFAEYRHLPGGLYGQTAVYSEHFHHVAIMRRVLLRMAAWMNYVFPLH